MQRFTSSLKVLYMQANHRERWLLPEISWHDFTAAILQSSSEKLCVGRVFFSSLFLLFSFFFTFLQMFVWLGFLAWFFIAQAVSLVDNVVCRVFMALHMHSVMPMFFPPTFFSFPPTGCFFFCVLLALLFMAYLVYLTECKEAVEQNCWKVATAPTKSSSEEDCRMIVETCQYKTYKAAHQYALLVCMQENV